MKFENEENELKISFEAFKKRVLEDYRLAVLSRECSLLGRREVFSGKGKFGIFGDGKELPQLAMNHFFQNGDFRSGYYRDQTLLMAQGLLTVANIFSALYAHLDQSIEPMSGGRQMGGHFATPFRNDKGEWLDLVNLKNHSGDISPTGSQMPRLLGLAQASKVYREHKTQNSPKFSNEGNEIAWGTIGNASTSEGMFFETINAAGVLQVPMVISIWDDGYGISVSNKDQTTKESISEALQGFQRTDTEKGLEIIRVKGWDYLALIEAYEKAATLARTEHVPVMVHVTELTQPLGHSSSGSHERYKLKERLEWEKAYDCNLKMREWILKEGLAKEAELIKMEEAALKQVRAAKRASWEAYQAPIFKQKAKLLSYLPILKKETHNDPKIQIIFSKLEQVLELGFKDIISAARQIKIVLSKHPNTKLRDFDQWLDALTSDMKNKVSSHLYNVSKDEFINFKAVKPKYNKDAETVDGRIIIRDNFEALLNKHDSLLFIGEDVGKIGDVNHGLEGLQAKFGELRIADTGIREATIVGQGIGLALRGLRPIAEIQYLDYILYCIQI